MAFFRDEGSPNDFMLRETILNPMVPLTSIYSQPIHPRFDLQKGYDARKILRYRKENGANAESQTRL